MQICYYIISRKENQNRKKSKNELIIIILMNENDRLISLFALILKINDNNVKLIL